MSPETVMTAGANRFAALWVALCLIAGAAAAADLFQVYPKRLRVGPRPSAMAAADLNGDDLPEIVTADVGAMSDPNEERPANDHLSFLVARGDLVYEAQPPLRTGFAPYSVAVAHISSPDAPDVLAGNFLDAKGNRDLSLFCNLGHNLFEPVHFTVSDTQLQYTKVLDGGERPVFTTPGITSIAVADFNRDELPDVAAAGWSSDIIAVFPGMPEGYFAPPRLVPAEGGPRDLAAADFDGDGALDLAAAMYSAGELAFWRNDGEGVFSRVNHFPSRGRLPHKLCVADMNLDGKLDVVVSHCHQDDSIAIFFGGGSFQFPTSQEIVLGEHRDKLEHEIRDILVYDLDADGKPDIAAACSTSKQVAVFFNRTDRGAASFRFDLETHRFDERRPRALCTGDFDANGKTDLAAALWDANAVVLLLHREE